MAERGISLVELMVALALGLVVVLMAMLAFGGNRQLFVAESEARTVEESLRFAAFVVRRTVRHAGYADRAAGDSAVAAGNDPFDLDIVGARNTRVGASGESYGKHGARGVNDSDSLLVRFAGSSRTDDDGNATEADGTMVDCMGFAQAAPGAGTATPADRAWSIFHVAEAADGEPELYCKYRGDRGGSFRSEPLARGIEVFRVLFGRDLDGDGTPEQWLDAAQLDALATASSLGHAAWRQVVALRIGMVARSARPGRWPPPEEAQLHPLGPEFPSARFRPAADGRLRRVMSFTVALRNSQREDAP
ncbi:PilW family protein [Variovorax sp. CY25R-8]|uniref:PilW family protein n=1 Tax=Variovorax sp. CY25R-8 TaxID=2855501 RepID=UPI0021BA90E1|nr:PilW family protein [Variovorax sp. CY25R-8]MCT8177989.1 PilW family protein [Variovorax sp. CY25R-8]